jgi:hypothetical protein
VDSFAERARGKGSYGGATRVHRPGAHGEVHVEGPNNSSPCLTGSCTRQCLVRGVGLPVDKLILFYGIWITDSFMC